MIEYFSLLILYLLFSFINLITVFGYSTLFYRDKDPFDDNIKYLISILITFVFLSLITLLLNFIFPLNNFISSIFLIFGIIIFFFNFKKLGNKLIILKSILLLSFLSSFVTLTSKTYPDFLLYHLPYANTVDNFKIIFGLSNLDFRYGHTSIIQNLNSLFSVKYSYFQNGFLININFSILILYLLFLIYKNEKSVFPLIFYFFSFCFFIIHGYRYGAYGNDFLPSILMCTVVTSLYSFLSKINKNDSFQIILLASVLAFTMKITMAVGIIIILFLLIFYKEKILLSKISIFLSIFLIFSLFSKNFINTSCLIYPLKITCFDTPWSPKNIYDFSSANVISERSSSASKDILKNKDFYNNKELKLYINKTILNNKDLYSNLSDYQKKNFIFFHENYFYNNNYNWLKNYYKNHFSDQIFPKIIVYLIIILLLSFLLNLYYFDFRYKYRRFFNNLFTIEILIINLFMLFGLIAWFINAPHLRYGIIYLLYFSIIPGIMFFDLNSNLTHIKKIKVFFRPILFIVLFYFLIKNIIMVYENYLKNGYLISNIFIENNKFETAIIDTFDINFPLNENNCENIKPLCVKYKNAFISSDYTLRNNFSYIFVTNKIKK